MHRLLLLLILVFPMSSHAIEEPDYQVIRTIGEIEVRRYAPYRVAEVVLEVPADEAGNQAFPILAGYIFGKNKGDKRFAMTAPVTQTAAPMRMEMTAPVTQSPVAGGTRVQFVLPRNVTLETAPEPLDPRVKIREEAAATWAVIRYSGRWTPENNREQLGKLKAALQDAQLTAQGEPVLARYNPPFTPWFMRRNELWLSVVTP